MPIPVLTPNLPVTTPTKPTGTGLQPLKPTVLPAPTPDITLPPNLRRPPTGADLIINRTFDGMTPQACAERIVSGFKGTIAPQNKKLVDDTVTARVRDMQVALNNAYTPNTPPRKFLESKLPASIDVLGSLSNSNPIVYRITRPNAQPEYYMKDWSGGMVQMPKAPGQVVMEARITLDPAGLKMNYPSWQNPGLAADVTTITEGR